MDILRLVLPIEPVAQGRPKFSLRTGRAYDPSKSRRFKRELRALCQNELSDPPTFEPFQGAIELDLIFYKPLLKSFTKKQCAQALQGVLLPVKKPDLDNYIKSTLDALNGLLWVDDAQIVKLTTRKRYANTARIDLVIKRYHVANGEEADQ